MHVPQKFELTDYRKTFLSLASATPSQDGVCLKFAQKKGSSFLLGKGHESCSVVVPGWPGREGVVMDDKDFVCTLDHDKTLAQMLLSHQTADFCIVGGKVMVVCVCVCVCYSGKDYCFL